MLIRIWRSDFDTTRRDELQRFADEISAPMFRRLPGCLGFVYGAAGSTWITQTFWDSEQHIEEAEASELYQNVVSRILGTGFLGDDQRTEVFEVTAYEPPSRPQTAST